MTPSLTITVHNRQRKVPIDARELQAFAECALQEILKHPRRKTDVLAQLSEIAVAVVSDRRMASLHHRFLGDPKPTDVITFQHGEIVISAETARRQARTFRTSLERELHLYIVHGLLHLRGFDDKKAAGAAEMKRLQEKLVDRALRRSMGDAGSRVR